MYELLTASGHSDHELQGYSPDKIRFFFEKAVKRRERESAGQQLAMLSSVMAAIGGAIGGDEGRTAFRQMEAMLIRKVNGQTPAIGQKRVLSMLQKSLGLSGAQVSGRVMSKN